MWTIVEVIDFWANPNYLVRKGTQKNVALLVAVLHVFKYFKCYQTCEQHQSQCSFNFAHGRAEYASKRLHKNHVHFANHWRAWADFDISDLKGSDGYDMTHDRKNNCDPWNLRREIGWNQRVVMVYPSLSVYTQFHKWRSCADPICIRQLTTSPSSPNIPQCCVE